MPEPDHVAQTMQTYDAIAAQYGITATPEMRAWEEASMRRFVSYLSGRAVLVPACGDGRDSRFLSGLGTDVISFDLSVNMLRLAQERDASGVYRRMDLRAIDELAGPYDGVWASGCLYHLTKSEFAEWLEKCRSLLARRGVLYLSMKEGHGERFEDGPGPGYPGGSMAGALLRGKRYYAYYQRSELLRLFAGFDLLHEQRVSFDERALERQPGPPGHATPEPAHLGFFLRAS